MKVSDLAECPDRRADVIALMQKEFPRGQPQSSALPFDDEFGALLRDNPPERILFIEDNGLVVSALGWKSFLLKQGLKIAAIGLVVTDSAHRKKGHSRNLVLEAEKRAHAEQCALACLWSDLLEFYTKLGYVLASSEISWDLSEVPNIEELAVSENFDDPTIREITTSDVSELMRLYANDPLGPARDESVFLRQLRQSDTLSLVAAPQGKPAAYALCGKGRDLRNVIHELVGDQKYFPALIEHARNVLARVEPLTAVRLQFPVNHHLQEELEVILNAGEQGAVCFAKILIMDDVVVALNAEFKVQGFESLRIKYMSDLNAWTLEDSKQDIFMSPDPAHLLQIFAHPWDLEELEGLPGRTLKRLVGWQPYPLYFWGPDGV
ncbi:MAG: GNAT family N-acetyltransferase [Bdellovibrionota bacterium]